MKNPMEMANVVPFPLRGDECPEWGQGKELTVPKRTKIFVLVNKAFWLELFARRAAQNWACWGHEIDQEEEAGGFKQQVMAFS